MMCCDACGVAFSGELDRCPLCGSSLAGDPEPSPFPENRVQRPALTARYVLASLTVLAVAALAAVGAAVALTPLAVGAGVAALALNYLFLRNVLTHSPDFLRIVERYFLVLLAVAMLWWLVSGYDPAVSVVIPALCLAALVTNTALVAVFRDAFVRDYAKYLVYSFVLGLVPLALALTGVAQWPWGAYASAAAAAALGVALVLLSRRQLASELKKLFSA